MSETNFFEAKRLMGVDYGDARVGVALSDSLGITAQGFCILENKGPKKLCAEIARIAKEKGVSTIVVGLPKNMNNSVGARGEISRAFAERLAGFTDAEIALWDERLSTVAALGVLNELNRRGAKRKTVLDAAAAAFILENYMKAHGS
jgi:putative Holliday junction resolvase